MALEMPSRPKLLSRAAWIGLAVLQALAWKQSGTECGGLESQGILGQGSVHPLSIKRSPAPKR